MRRLVPYFVVALTALPVSGATIPVICGSYPERVLEELHLSRQERRTRAASRLVDVPANRIDIGNVALIDRSAGVLGRRNDFDLVGRAITFEPVDSAALRYRVVVESRFTFAPAGGEQLALGDDATTTVALPFAFPFFGSRYESVFVNSDGNLTFGSGDDASSERSLGRVVAGPPRIAPLFVDLDPSRAGRVTMSSSSTMVEFAWLAIPLFQTAGTGVEQTFRVRLHSDGRIEFLFESVSVESAVTGIAPGEFRGRTSIVSFGDGVPGEFDGTVAEVFERNPGIDLVRVAQRFYETHGDNYDYLAVFNNLGVSPGGAIAFQIPVRVTGDGYGLRRLDLGREFGSRRRLQSMLNMGPLSQYPADPRAVASFRPGAGESTLTILAHEAGHQYLSFVSVPDSTRPGTLPMLGRQQAHWSFFFNSEASILEGNRIVDRGEGVSPRFNVTGTTEAYSALDRYLMGLGEAEAVPPTFFVRPRGTFFRAEDSPRMGATFDGDRVDITPEAILTAGGRRAPDSTVAQDRFRMAFVLVVDEGAMPGAAEVDQLERLRREFEDYFRQATGGRGLIDGSLKRELRLSVFPAGGVVRGESGRLAVELPNPSPADLPVRLRVESGLLGVPESVTIPAGESRVSFQVAGLGTGVDRLTAEPAREEFDRAVARIQVAETEQLRLTATDGGGEILVRVTDRNGLVYPGASVMAAVSGNSVLGRTVAETDDSGLARFPWQRALGTVEVSVGSASASVSGVPVLASVLNAASLEARVAPGSLASAFGLALDGADIRVTVAGEAAQVVRNSVGQIDFVVPPGAELGLRAVVVESSRGISPPLEVLVAAVAPAVFVDGATGLGAIVSRGEIRPFATGEIVEIYATGLSGAITARFSSVAAELLFAGASPGLPGVQQVNARVPDTLAPGEHTVVLTSGGESSPPVRIRVVR